MFEKFESAIAKYRLKVNHDLTYFFSLYSHVSANSETFNVPRLNDVFVLIIDVVFSAWEYEL